MLLLVSAVEGVDGLVWWKYGNDGAWDHWGFVALSGGVGWLLLLLTEWVG